VSGSRCFPISGHPTNASSRRRIRRSPYRPVITGFNFRIKRPELRPWDLQTAVLTVDVHARVFQDLQLEPIDWDFSLHGQAQTRNGRMVVRLPANGTLPAFFWIPFSAITPLVWDHTGDHSHAIGDLVDVVGAQNVEIFQEFPDTGSPYVSFRASLAARSSVRSSTALMARAHPRRR
jgi:hypothetical protein